MVKTKYKLAVFDVNGVLTDRHSIVDIAEFVDTKAEVEGYINQHTAGKMNLSNALLEACRLLEGVSRKQIEEYSWEMPLLPGVQEMAEALTENGVVLGIITTGFRTTMEIINQRIGNLYKYIICNDLVFDENGFATGGIKFSVVENESKADRLRELMAQEGVKRYQTVAVGDSAGDMEMLKAAGLGIAFNPNKTLEEFAKANGYVIIKEKDLRNIVPYVLGK